MTSLLHRIGDACVRHPGRTIGAWILVLVAALGLASAAGGEPRDDYDVPGTRSQQGTDLLRRVFPALSGSEARVVVHRADGQRLDAAAVAQVVARLGQVPDVGQVDRPLWSADGDTVLIGVRYTEPVTDLGDDVLDRLRAPTGPATAAGAQVEFAGQVGEREKAGGSVGEAAGVLAALIVLVVAFGSVLAAGLPIVAALFGLGVGSAGVLLLAAVTEVGSTAPTVAAMVGLGVGIDYALLLVTRYVEGVSGGLEPAPAAMTAVGTAGRSVLAAGATVLVSLCGLLVSGLATFRSLGYATAVIVVVAMVAALTLVPALCAVAGRRLLGRRRRAQAPVSTASAGTERWARRVVRRPVAWGLAALVVLVALAVPTLSMRTWPQDAGSQPAEVTSRRAYDIIAAEYGPGAYAPLLVGVDLAEVGAAELPALRDRLAAEPGVAAVSEPVIAPDRAAAALTVQTAYAPSDERSTAMIEHLRERVLPPGAEITGVTAVFADIADLLAERLWIAISLVVVLSVLVLTVVFRSVLIPLKAAVVNLFSVAAAYGVLTAVFQWGWGSALLGVDRPVPVSTWIPLVLFTVLFGLSMDYEVFLISRIREHWLATGEATGSIVRGLAATGRTITCAALIMVVVFAGFVSAGDLVTKMIGVGLATAVAVDATLVRLVLVPAAMTLLGRANWWAPRWLRPERPATT